MQGDIMKNWKAAAAAVLCGIGVCLTGCAAGAKTDKAVPQQGEAVGGQKRMKIWFDTLQDKKVILVSLKEMYEQ